MKHRWEIVDAGEYDSIHRCVVCKKRHLVSIDNPASMPPKEGCVPSTAEIKKEVAKLESNIAKLQGDIAALRALCKHPNLKKKHGANTGNYDPMADCYWTDFDCPDCGKRWTEDGSK